MDNHLVICSHLKGNPHEEMSRLQCKTYNHSYWTDCSVHWDRPKECPYRNETVNCDMFYDWDEWERRAPVNMKRPREGYDT
jgi:hypothetical protein